MRSARPLPADTPDESLQWFRRGAPGSLGSNVLAAGLLLIGAYEPGAPAASLRWLGLLAVALLLRLAVPRAQARWPERLSARHWLRLYRLSFLMLGMAWGTAAPLMGGSPENAIYVALTLVLLSSAVLIVHAYDLPAALLFAMPAVGGLYWLPYGDLPLPPMWALVVFSIMVTIGVAAMRVRQLMREHDALRRLDAKRLAALRLGEERLREAQQVARVGSFDWNQHTGAVNWSDEHFRLWGLKPGSRVPDYELFRAGVHDEDIAGVEQQLEQALSGNADYDCNFRVRGYDGIERIIHGRGKVVLDADGKALRMIGTVQDITDSRRTQRELETYKFVVDSIGDPISIVDEHSVYHLVNKTWSKEIGIKASDALGRSAVELVPHVVSPEREQALRACIALRERRSVVRRMDLRGAGSRWWETTFHPYVRNGWQGAVVITRDVTPRIEAERALSSSVVDLQTTLNATGDAIVAIDASTKEHPVLFINQQMLQMWHMPGDAQQPRTAKDVLRAAGALLDAPETERLRVKAIVDQGRATQDRLQLRDGRVLLRRCIPTTRLGQQVRVWSFRDITNEAQAMAQIEQAKDEAERANHAKTQFLASMSHELRTPLNAVLGFAQLLEMDARLNPKQQRFASQIISAGNQLLTLITALLDQSRVEAGKREAMLESVALNELLEDCVSLVSPQAEQRQITIDRRPAAVANLQTDRQCLQQALLNLLSNAVKYTQVGGRVQLDSHLGHDMLCIEVSDNGPGIALDRQAELFQPFNRLGAEHGPVEGTGIGLAISRSLIELAGGRIEVSSSAGKGSRFSILLPIDLPIPLPGQAADASPT